MWNRRRLGFTPSKSVAFTLIELLVVIAIIAVLAAILFPVFAQARGKARQAACLSNMKQVSLAILQYNQDYDEAFPCGDNAGGYLSGRGWAARVYPYVKNTGVLRCPDDPTEDATGLNGQPGEVDTVVSYGFNRNLDGRLYSLPQVNRSASTVLLFEVQGAHQWLNGPNGDYSTATFYSSSVGGQGGDSAGPGFINLAWNGTATKKPQYATGTPGQPTAALGEWVVDATRGRHSTGSNVGLADGHSKWLQRQTLSVGYEALSSNNDQDSYYAAGSDFVGTAPKNFVATFSPR